VLKKYPMLILPFTIAASPDLVARLIAYVREGGVLVGDLRCLRFDAHGKPISDSTAFEPLFGVRRTGGMDYGSTKVVFRRAAEGIDLHGAAVAAFGREGLTAAGATALAQHASGEPAALVHRLGEGMAVYLNFGLPAYDVTMRELMRQLCVRAGVPRPVVVESPKPGGPPPRAYERNTFLRGPIAVHGFIRDYRRCSDTAPVRFRFPRAAHIYDMRARRYLGKTNTVETTLPPGETALYACLPYRVQRVFVSGPGRVAAGAVLEVTAQVTTDAGRPGDHRPATCFHPLPGSLPGSGPPLPAVGRR